MIKSTPKFNFTWKFINSFKIAIPNATKNVFLLLTYFFGTGAVSEDAVNILTASKLKTFNIISDQVQCTSNELTYVDISYNKFNIKTLTKRALPTALSCTVVMLSSILILDLTQLNLNFMLFIIFTHLFDNIVCLYISPILSEFTQQGKIKFVTFTKLSMAIFRFIFTLILTGAYSVYIATILSLMIEMVIMLVYYLVNKTKIKFN